MHKIAIIGAGVIGAGWAARFALNGKHVKIFDPAPYATQKMEEVLALAKNAWYQLYSQELQTTGKIEFCDTIAETVADADWIQENTPEVLESKHQVLRDIQSSCSAEAVIASSTSGLTPSQLRQESTRPEQIIVAHPFNPVYLLPLVELVGLNPKQQDNFYTKISSFITEIGMYPLFVRQEIDAHIADRLLEAVWREALWLVKDGIATTAEIDESIRLGFGLRWAQMGLFETYRIAGGTAGMKHFMAQFGPCLTLPWTRLTDVPEFNDTLVDTIAQQSDQQSGKYSIRELEAIRDQNLVGFLRHLKQQNWGAGKIIAVHEQTLITAQSTQNLGFVPITFPLRHPVSPSWIDYNGHMTESRYLYCASLGTDALLDAIGAGLDYVADGHSYYTAESHIVHLREAKLGQMLEIQGYILSFDQKRLHVLLTVSHAGKPLAYIEQMCLHVNMHTAKVCPAPQTIIDTIARLQQQQPDSIPQEYIGRRIVGHHQSN